MNQQLKTTPDLNLNEAVQQLRSREDLVVFLRALHADVVEEGSFDRSRAASSSAARASVVSEPSTSGQTT